MAGESILKIREQEQAAAEVISAAKAEAKKIVQMARSEEPSAFEEKDKQLAQDEKMIRERQQKESRRGVEELQSEENGAIGEIDRVCGSNFEGVVDFLTKEIVKE